MTESLSKILLALFSVHLMVFSGLYYRCKTRRYMLFVLLFFLLVLSYILRLWGPHLSLFGHAAHEYVRFAAWIATMVSVFFWVKQKRNK